jgi:hypothetical protein
MIHLTNENCMDLMSRFPDGYFDLAIVDPPYGGGHHEQHNHKLTLTEISPQRFGGRFDKYRPAQADLADDLTGTIQKKKRFTPRAGALPNTTGGLHGRAEPGLLSTGRTLMIGTLPRRRNTLRNWPGSQNGGLCGAEIILIFRLPGILSSGES